MNSNVVKLYEEQAKVLCNDKINELAKACENTLENYMADMFIMFGLDAEETIRRSSKLFEKAKEQTLNHALYGKDFVSDEVESDSKEVEKH
ncbi:MAG: hypothetical protein GY861_22370 [bacterium]|nr:hypothetical protein [bacterium]